MIFPFVIKYSKRFEFTPSNEQIVLKTLTKELKKLKIDQIEIEKHEIKFSNSLFNGQNIIHVLSPIDAGLITINKEQQNISFQFSTMRTFYIACALAVLTGIILQDKLVGVGLFFWIYGFNIIASYIRLPNLVQKFINVI